MSSLRIEQLESMLRSNGIASQPGIRSALDRLQFELAERVSQASPQSSDFVFAAMRALRRMKGNGNAILRLDCIRQCYLFFMQQGNYPGALEAASLNHELATQLRSPQARTIALRCMGSACAEAGNVGQALIYYSEAFQLAREMRDTDGEMRVLNNLGSALNYAGLYREAISCFQRVGDAVRPEWDGDIGRKAFTNLAQSYYYLEEFDRALVAAQRCVARDAPPANTLEHFEQTVREFTFVQIALELGRDGLAHERALLCWNHATFANSAISRMMAQISLGRCEVRAGKSREGLMILEKVVAASSVADSSYRDALAAIAKGYDEAGQPEVALKYVEQLLSHVRERRTSGVIALLGQPDAAVDTRGLSGKDDFRALEVKHAELRAQIAEHAVATSRMEMLERLAVTADLKEDASGEHGYRVGRLSALLAAQSGLREEAVKALEAAARLHDIGKIGIPDRILGSSARLKEGERHFMQTHTAIGSELLARSDVAQLKMAEEIARHHHEWWDGSGYPDKLAGKYIPLPARIVALADVLDALTHGRPYAAPWSMDRALQEIRERRGTQFDPALTDRFLKMVAQLRNEHSDLDAYLGKAGQHSPFLQARQRIRGLLEEARDHEMEPVLH